ncbi:MAG: class I SAM-dependent RNA methyltransferase [Prolixibacteraceae bacterium]|nr:class I SAM-dependent RNA methyltransferase [Prolixibacteraceae bacterium]MDI9563539.1 class I SAM-dependent RNA methyltransferase [Bacteroidota bacterium]NLS99031.1 class I SAM-dependent RNA methyltransferase [Bacteroidales bacterium]HNU76891.1 class I SAM-dependent RNA methyltransferase [Prolixibacteraceae bacterium]HNZ68191.1 class I SAM-dependent RNA methyltransferase [Prolixibacteraceae bacterium]
METYTLTAKTLEGLEEVLAEEISALGGKEITPGIRAVSFRGDKGMVYRANYRLRTAIRIFRQINAFNFSNLDDFFIKCLKIKWEQFMKLNDTFVVQSTVMQSALFKNSMYASLKLKDAIADRFRQKTGSRPSVDTAEPDVIFHIHISGQNCIISLDSSGESLHKRGYRQSQGDAPLNEVLAAGMILLSGWKGNCDFMDPMCGSGTLPIEAALIAKNIPPGKFRKSFAFMNWSDFEPELFEKIKGETTLSEFTHHIYASDILTKNVLSAKTNARNARVFNLISFDVSDFAKVEMKSEKSVIMMNPPYGERIRHDNLEHLYQMIGERLKHHFTGHSAWILSASPEMLQKIGLRPSEKHRLYNGAMECSFQKYELFVGKRKQLVIKRKLNKKG